MTFSITVELLRGVYASGSSERREDTEWPPSPARLFCALVAAAAGDDECEPALGWLEAQAPPCILASPATAVEVSVQREGYPPLNDGPVGDSAYGRFPARKAGALQRWRHVSPQAPVVRYEWTADPAEQVVSKLAELVDAVPYLGRSTCPVQLRIEQLPGTEIGDERVVPEHLVRWEPGGLGDRVTLGVPRSGYLRDLNEAFDDGRRAHEVVRRQLSYGVERPVPTVESSAHDDDLIVLTFDNRRIGSTEVMSATRALLKALESHLDGGPLVLRGATADQERPRQQALLLGLPQVGFPHSSGLIAGLAVALPRDIAPADRRAILRAIVEVDKSGLNAGRMGRFEFSSELSGLRSLDPTRWTGPARTWVSATPMSADRFVRLERPAEARAEVERACTHAGLPLPESVEVSQRPIAEGAENVAPHQRRRRPDDRPTPSFHARITFAGAVRGPVVLGNLRRYGLGLFAPESD